MLARHASVVLLCYVVLSAASTRDVFAAPPPPNHADIAYGAHPHQRLDIYLPTSGKGPYPVLVWFGGLWKPAKHPVRLDYFPAKGVAVVAVQLRTMNDAVEDKVSEPISYVMGDADRADPKSTDPVLQQSTRVTCVAAYRCQPSIDPQRMQEWVPGVKWGAPALGCSFEESLKRRDELLPIIRRWSPDALIHSGAAPIYFENEWSLTKPDDITQVNYDVHSPAWGLGFQKLAQQAGAVCYVKFPGRPTEGYADIWDFVVKELKANPTAK